MDEFPTAEEQWNAITTCFTVKCMYTKADLHQAFLDMRCLKGGDVQEYLTSLKMKRHKLKVANVGITNIKYKCTILKGIPDMLATYAVQSLSTLRLAVKYTGKPIDMSDVIDSVCEEADHIKQRRKLKDHSQGQGKGRKGAQTDEALAATTFEHSNNNNFANCCKKGKCNHCSKEGHWIRECHTKKQEEAAVQSSGQSAQASSSSKPENKPVGSANTVTVDDKDDLDNRGFWAVEEEEVHLHFAEPDSWMDNTDSDDENEDFCTKIEESNECLDWPDIEGEDWYTKDTAMAVISPDEADIAPCTELYDSGVL